MAWCFAFAARAIACGANLALTADGEPVLAAGLLSAAPDSFCHIAGEAGSDSAGSKLACTSASDALNAKHNRGFFIRMILFSSPYRERNPIPYQLPQKIITTCVD